jgi:flagellar hook assembly protein FlgD
MLHPNIPNPFNPTTTIRFDLAGSGRVTLRVFDVRGRVVRTLVDGLEPAGHRLVEWDGRNDGGRVVPSGTYFYRLTAPGFEQTRTMLMLK